MQCLKCGNEMAETDRICKSCGELNRKNPQNAHLVSLMKHDTNARNTAFDTSIQKNALLASQPKSQYKNPIKTQGVEPEITSPESTLVDVETKETPKVEVPKIFDILMHLVNILAAAIYTGVLYYFFPKYLMYILIGVLIYMFYTMSTELLFKKANIPWVWAVIPVANIFFINKMTFKNGLIWIVVLIPLLLIIGAESLGVATITNTLWFVQIGIVLVYTIGLMYKTGYRFGMEPALMAIFFIFLYPFIAFRKDYKYYGK